MLSTMRKSCLQGIDVMTPEGGAQMRDDSELAGQNITEDVVRPDAGGLITRRELLRDAALAATGMAGLDLFGQLASNTNRVEAAPPLSSKDTIVVGWHSSPESLDPIKQFDLGYAVQVSETMWRL